MRPSGRRILPCDVRWSTRTKCAPARNRRSQSAMGRAAGFAWCRPTPSWWTPFAQCHTVAQATKFSRARRQATVHQDRGPVDLRGDHESVIAGGRYGNRRQRASQSLAAARRERQWQTSVQTLPLFPIEHSSLRYRSVASQMSQSDYGRHQSLTPSNRCATIPPRDSKQV